MVWAMNKTDFISRNTQQAVGNDPIDLSPGIKPAIHPADLAGVLPLVLIKLVGKKCVH